MHKTQATIERCGRWGDSFCEGARCEGDSCDNRKPLAASHKVAQQFTGVGSLVGATPVSFNRLGLPATLGKQEKALDFSRASILLRSVLELQLCGSVRHITHITYYFKSSFMIDRTNAPPKAPSYRTTTPANTSVMAATEWIKGISIICQLEITKLTNCVC
jgi:hypothetical protein